MTYVVRHKAAKRLKILAEILLRFVSKSEIFVKKEIIVVTYNTWEQLARDKSLKAILNFILSKI